MEGDLTLTAIVSGAFFGAMGYGLRTVWDSYNKHWDTIRIEVWKIRASQLEQRLSRFFWPVYLRLQRDNVVWRRILDRFEHVNPSDEERRKIAFELENTVIIPNHLETVKIIQSAIHLADVDKELEALLMAYLRHVDVYTSIRSAGIRAKDPINFGEAWPKGLFAAVEQRLVACQREYEELLRDKGILNLGGLEPVRHSTPTAPGGQSN
jgi:hypothetical protein